MGGRRPGGEREQRRGCTRPDRFFSVGTAGELDDASGSAGHLRQVLIGVGSRAAVGRRVVCNGAAEPRHTPRGTVWTFDLHAVAEGWDGVIPDAFGAAAGSIGLRAVVLFVDPRASNAVATLRDHEVIHNMRTHSLPRKLHRQARIAWSVQSVTGVQVRGNGVLISRAVAYDSGGQVVGRFPPPRP